MSRAESHEVGGEGKDEGSSGGGEGDGRLSQEKGVGDLLKSERFSFTVNVIMTIQRCDSYVTLN